MLKDKRPVIETERLMLVRCTNDILEALFEGEDSLSKHLDITIPSQWTEFGDLAFRWTYDQLQLPGAKGEWFSYLPILKDGSILVGSCGYKGAPKDGIVEIGYEVATEYRNRGLACEIAAALITNALSHEEVVCIQAHTLAEENASVAVLRKNGMMQTASLNDPEDGDIWQWKICRQPDII